jgi:hypothetical protein
MWTAKPRSIALTAVAATAQPLNGRGRLRRWITKVGYVGFASFSIKGLIWLIVPAALAFWSRR